jgi:hypothetical protein
MVNEFRARNPAFVGGTLLEFYGIDKETVWCAARAFGWDLAHLIWAGRQLPFSCCPPPHAPEPVPSFRY